MNEQEWDEKFSAAQAAIKESNDFLDRGQLTLARQKTTQAEAILAELKTHGRPKISR